MEPKPKSISAAELIKQGDAIAQPETRDQRQLDFEGNVLSLTGDGKTNAVSFGMFLSLKAKYGGDVLTQAVKDGKIVVRP